MRITRIELQKLYGSMSKIVDFKDELNLLVGINGSGKTSILNAIDWLLRPNLGQLATTQFESLILNFEHNGDSLELEAKQHNNKLTMHLKGVTGHEFHPIAVDLLVDPSKIHESTDVEPMVEHYNLLGPDIQEIKLWEYLKDIPKPVVITLDRTITAEVENLRYSDREPRLRQSLRSRVLNPLEKVREVTALRYGQYRSRLIELNDELKARIVMSALSVPEAISKRGKATKSFSLEEIDRLEQKVTSYLSTAIRGVNPDAQIKSFFRRVQTLVKKSSSIDKKTDQDFVWALFARQYHQIEELAQAFNDFELNSANSYERLKLYFDQINLFLRDSKKRIFFDEKLNQIRFNFIKEDGSVDNMAHSIDCMSSGERQILILFTFLEFIADPERIFIVDEPELSLHPKWQRDFLDAFLMLKPKSTQLLLATHSPEIVGRRKSRCLVLSA